MIQIVVVLSVYEKIDPLLIWVGRIVPSFEKVIGGWCGCHSVEFLRQILEYLVKVSLHVDGELTRIRENKGHA